MKKYYITTSIPYVNGSPHLGHALEYIQADTIARYHRTQGFDVLFATGTDEHGTKVYERATELQKDPKAYTDELSAVFIDVLKQLNISNNRFIRTSDDAHKQRSQLIWKAMEADIYKSTYSGLYDVTQEEFVPESQADPERLNPDHPKAYRRLEEENYFFKMSKYTEAVKKAIESDTLKITPKSRKNEIMSVLEQGLTDISISRPASKLPWGVPVPGDTSQVMYVWFEAVMNYITVLGYPEHEDFKKFWPADVQVIGKDILRFHAAIWPSILLSLGLPVQHNLLVHGFITVGNEKMSKSIGNVIDPVEVTKTYGVDAFRYYLLRHIPTTNDGDFTMEKFVAAYNGELANELGNSVQRVATMLRTYQDGVIGDIPEPNHDRAIYDSAMQEFWLDRALEHVWEQVRGLNQYIDTEKPWIIAKELDGGDHLKEVLAYCVGCILEIAELLEPFLPDTSAKIQTLFADGLVHPSTGTLFPRIEVSK